MIPHRKRCFTSPSADILRCVFLHPACAEALRHIAHGAAVAQQQATASQQELEELRRALLGPSPHQAPAAPDVDIATKSIVPFAPAG